MIEKETIFRSAADENERRHLFEEYVVELRKQEAEREANERKQAMEELTTLLKSLILEPYTRWSEAQDIIQENETFKSESLFQALNKLDVLTMFEGHIKFLERAQNDRRQKQKSAKLREERKHREDFVVSIFFFSLPSGHQAEK